MKMITSWAFASAAVVAILVAGCTTETTDTSEGGVSTTGAAGTRRPARQARRWRRVHGRQRRRHGRQLERHATPVPR